MLADACSVCECLQSCHLRRPVLHREPAGSVCFRALAGAVQVVGGVGFAYDFGAVQVGLCVAGLLSKDYKGLGLR